MSELVQPDGGALKLTSEQEDAAWRQYEKLAAESAQSKNTRDAYKSDWNQWTAWLEAEGMEIPTTPKMVGMAVGKYIDAHKHMKPATLRRRVVGIRHGMLDRGHPWPTFLPGRNSMQNQITGIAKDQNTGRTGSPALPVPLLRQMLSACGDSPKGIRDRAIFLIAFYSGMRRGNVADLDVSDVEFFDEGIALHQRSSKTDKEARGRTVYIPLKARREACAVRAVQSWLKVRGTTPGPLFISFSRWGIKSVDSNHRISGSDINRLLQEVVRATGEETHYTAHSLRAGLATAAGQKGATAHDIARQTGHHDMNQVEHYIRDGRGFEDNVVHLLDL